MEPQKFGRYEIKSELGRGGFGTVFYAFDPLFKRDVALKVLPREFLHDPNFRARFEREAQTIAGLEHPAIVPVYDFGQEDSQPYLVMRYLSGGSLTTRLHQGALPLAEVIRIIGRIAPALAEAHGQGIIHRDLKPDNILFDRRNDPYITDFGLVKVTQDGGGLTSDNVIIGTPAYMSPEQARGEANIDGRSDIYALGIILFEMLTGRLPYQANSPVGILMQHLTEPPPRILEVAPNLPPGCELVISRALAKEPDKRFTSAIDLAAALTELNRQQAPASQPDLAKGVITPTPGSPAMISHENTQSPPSVSPPPGAPAIPKPAKGVICFNCHTQNQADAIHCVHCGANMQSAELHRRDLLESRRKIRQERERMLKEKEARQLQEKLEGLMSELTRQVKHEFVIYQLNQIGEPAINPLVDTLLKHNNRNARYGAAKALGEICSNHQVKPLAKTRAIRGLIKALEDSEPAVRYYAAEGLGKLSSQAQLAVEPLGALLKDHDENVRKRARASLEQIGGERARQLLESTKGFLGWLKG